MDAFTDSFRLCVDHRRLNQDTVKQFVRTQTANWWMFYLMFFRKRSFGMWMFLPMMCGCFTEERFYGRFYRWNFLSGTSVWRFYRISSTRESSIGHSRDIYLHGSDPQPLFVMKPEIDTNGYQLTTCKQWDASGGSLGWNSQKLISILMLPLCVPSVIFAWLLEVFVYKIIDG
jgi:hypothetical protein